MHSKSQFHIVLSRKTNYMVSQCLFGNTFSS